MWQKFTESARKVVFYSQEAAQELGSSSVGPEHLLLGLLRPPSSRAGVVLLNLGVDPDTVRARLKAICLSTGAGPSQDMTLTPKAKKAIDHALAEAKGLDSSTIGPEHLLLGLLTEPDTLALQVLSEFGIDLERARASLKYHEPAAPARSVAPTPGESVSFWSQFTTQSRKVVFAATEEATRLGEGSLRTEHVLLGLVRDPESAVLPLIKQLGVDVAKLRGEIRRQIPWVEHSNKLDMNVSIRVRQTFELALEEAKALGTSAVEPVHLLLGLIREEDGLAARILSQFGVDLERAREAVRHPDAQDD